MHVHPYVCARASVKIDTVTVTNAGGSFSWCQCPAGGTGVATTGVQRGEESLNERPQMTG